MRVPILAAVLFALLRDQPPFMDPGWPIWLAVVVGIAMALPWLCYPRVREFILVSLFAIHLALSDEERAWVC